MNIRLQEFSDNTVIMMSEIGQSICIFHNMGEALRVCNEWHRANDDIMFEALEGGRLTQND